MKAFFIADGIEYRRGNFDFGWMYDLNYAIQLNIVSQNRQSIPINAKDYLYFHTNTSMADGPVDAYICHGKIFNFELTEVLKSWPFHICVKSNNYQFIEDREWLL